MTQQKFKKDPKGDKFRKQFHKWISKEVENGVYDTMLDANLWIAKRLGCKNVNTTKNYLYGRVFPVIEKHCFILHAMTGIKFKTMNPYAKWPKSLES